ncbi:M15 family metallopeptidase [Macrococcus equipercicus]|uniref:M15 family metallopeptidase n=1 Tax=Macrococcus equipercicus TaxID=69967 RepID=A0ABQ6R767_9STAP|nr:M15 family metallopeptidase [Macrococcus equipercicus]KAA1037712.1 M15 family metallopeptidase [Macrococcus equipercicus]
MKRLLTTVTAVLFLASCSTKPVKTELTPSTDSALHSLPLKKLASFGHVRTVKDGVTYIDGILIVNKQIALPPTYAPGENPAAKQAVERLMAAGNSGGLQFVIRSGYRSYSEQQHLYTEYVARDGQQAADQYSARPGHSEHQTGLTFDIGSVASVNDFTVSFGDTPEGAWLQQHAHDYGFIVRYPEGKTFITGYQYEPWHVRYVGTALASELYKNNETLEEYLGLYKKKSQ